MKRTVTAVACLLLVLSLMLTGCGSSSKEKLNDAVDEINNQLSTLESTYADTMEVAATAEGDNTIVLTYKILIEMDEAQSESFVQTMSATPETYESFVAIMSEYGIDSPVVRVVMLDSTGTEIYNDEFSE